MPASVSSGIHRLGCSHDRLLSVNVSFVDKSDEKDKHKGEAVESRPRVETDDGTRLKHLGFSPVAAFREEE